MKEKLMVAMHDVPLVGHLGFYKTYKLLKERFIWKGLKEGDLRHVRDCIICQKKKSEHTLLVGLL